MRFPGRWQRRNFLKTALGFISSGLLLGGRQPAAAEPVADSARVLGASPSKRGRRSRYESIERLVAAPSPAGVSFTPLEKLSGIITPSGLHFERHHAGVPDINPDSYALLIHGMVDRPLKFSLADLKRFPAVSRICFIECSGNGFQAALPPATIPQRLSPGRLDGLFSVSEWTGVRLSTLFHEAGARAGARWFLAEGGDAALMSRSIPIDKAWDDALVAYAQNGEPLRPEQGYPARLLLPGWEGNANVKWLRRLELSDAPFMTREETSKYSDAMEDGRIKMFTLQMAVKSLITTPSFPAGMAGKGWDEIRGLAWSGAGRIARVEVSVDAGRNWQAAELQAPVLSKCAIRFRFGWEWDGRETIIMSRATDEAGNTQLPYPANEKGRGPRTFYHNSGIRAWKIHNDGRVTFALRDLFSPSNAPGRG